MAERELFVICPNCGSEASPYVTECPYCGHRLRKRAPDLRKERREDEKAGRRAEREAERQRKRARRLLTGGRFGGRAEKAELPAYLRGSRPPIAVTTLIVLSVAASLAARVSGFPLGELIYGSSLQDRWWQLFSAPFFHLSFGYGFVCLLGVAMFGSGIERRFGSLTLVAVWLLCGALGVTMEHVVAPMPLTNGAIGIAAGMMAAWLTFVLMREDLRDYDSYALAAASAVLLAMPLATDEASVWTILGGLLAGVFCGLVLVRFRTADQN
ncbi:MAG: rhomboid family intramembrane serine protease [Thermoleophilia bacterium]|nr:rhomboid family intramembrane serine protease [Thermoleophilia bacterium]